MPKLEAAPTVPTLLVLPGRSLRRQRFWLISGAILGSGVLLALMVMEQRAQALRSTERFTEAFAQVIAEQTTRTFQTIDQRLQLSSARLDQLAGANRSESAVRAMLRSEIVELPFVRAFTVSDAEGRIVYSSDDDAVGADLSDRAYFQIYRTDPGTTFYIGPPIRSRTTGAWLIGASRPLRTPSGTFAGVIVAAVDQSFFDRLWKTPDLGDDGSISLFRRDGLMMMRSPFDEAVIGRAFLNVGIFAQPLDTRPAGQFVSTSVVDGTRRLFGYRVLPGYPDLIIVVGQAYRGVLAPWRQHAMMVFSVWAGACVVIAILSVFLERAGAERLRSAADAERMARRLTLATEASSIGVWDWDLKADSWYATPTYFSLLGYGPGQGIGSREEWLDHVHPDDRAVVASNIQAALDGADAPYRHDVRVRHEDGAYRWMSVTGRVLARDLRAKPVRLLGVMVDITEGKRAEEALREREELFATAFEEAPIGMALVSPEGRWLRVNRALCDLVGYTDVELRARTFQDITHPEDLDADLESVKQLLAGEIPSYQMEKRYLHASGRHVNVLLSVSLVRDRLGAPRYMISQIQDITERKRSGLALESSLREKEVLLKEIHHRVKNNLQVITSLLRLESGRTREAGTRSVLKEMQGRIRSMALLHETLYRSGNFASVELSEYLRQLANQLFRAQNTAPGRVLLVLDLSPVKVTIDHAIPCGLIVNELLTNSLKHGFAPDASGEVRVSLERETTNERILIRVSDTGVGLPEDFDSIRASSLGLQLVSDLARQLGGALEVGAPPSASFTVTFKGKDPDSSVDSEATGRGA